jgi:translation elongation factor EF-1alpha
MKRKSTNLTILKDCEISGDYFAGTATKLLSASRAKKISKHGTVLLGEVTNGQLILGAKITISINGRKLTDTVAQIERDRCIITYAVEGEPIGICLKTLRLRRIRSLLN